MESWVEIENSFCSGYYSMLTLYRNFQRCYLGDNCIVFENFTTPIGDLMVAN